MFVVPLVSTMNEEPSEISKRIIPEAENCHQKPFVVDAVAPLLIRESLEAVVDPLYQSEAVYDPVPMSKV